MALLDDEIEDGTTDLTPVAEFASANVLVCNDPDAVYVIDVRHRSGLWFTPEMLRELADELEA